MTISELHQLFLKYNSISTDTRNINPNALFFALKGESFNGNQFAKDALDKGASYAIVDEKEYAISANYILVDDVLKTLQSLATYHRDYLSLKIIALTGSNGKTTTKELIHNVLKQQYRTVATKGNFNNHIGVPLTLLSMDETTEIGIVEMGANHQKEIEFLCSIAKPNYGYITNFGKAHLEGFGGVEGVIKGKSELYTYLKTQKNLIFLNANDLKQIDIVGDYKPIYTFGSHKNNDVIIEFINANPFVCLNYSNIKINSQLIGKYNFDNISAAMTIGAYFNLSFQQIKKGIETYVPSNNRSQIITQGSNKIILDAYNANPTSMNAALTHFSSIKANHKIAILGDMFELGDDAKKEHQHIAQFATELDIDIVYLVGENFNSIDSTSTKARLFSSFNTLEKELNTQSFSNSIILIKGSRGMQLERVLDII